MTEAEQIHAARLAFEQAQDVFEAAEDALLDDGEGTEESLDALKSTAEKAFRAYRQARGEI